MALMQDTMAVTYAEIRWWAVTLDTFTASDLADSMGVSREWGERGVRALKWHGIVEGTGDYLDGVDGPEEICTYVPLPPGPDAHPHPHAPNPARLPPELAHFTIHVERGMPVRIRSSREIREKYAQGSGGARHRMKLAEARYEAQEEARRKRAAEQRAKADKEPKWLEQKRKRQKAARRAAREMTRGEEAA